MEYSSEIRRQFQNIAQESIAPLFNSVFGSSSQSPLVNPFSGIRPPTRITSPGSDMPPERPPLINGKGPVFVEPENAATRSPLFNPGFRPDATYSQGPFPPQSQLPGFLSPKGINSLSNSDFPRKSVVDGRGPVFPPTSPPGGFPLINGKGPVFEPPKKDDKKTS
ncbi:hypothetical protein CEXT_576811 [Caerostris extrusa]|uniref:Uncharacterized protein n=1 Tax=Caerostris extrusa TaxID=172846 RepID=A0AAV4XR98_CAEEX|nr:hypothetical protein CEXT_576811 [Caerostris extrusa]